MSTYLTRVKYEEYPARNYICAHAGYSKKGIEAYYIRALVPPFEDPSCLSSTTIKQLTIKRAIIHLMKRWYNRLVHTVDCTTEGYPARTYAYACAQYRRNGIEFYITWALVPPVKDPSMRVIHHSKVFDHKKTDCASQEGIR